MGLYSLRGGPLKSLYRAVIASPALRGPGPRLSSPVPSRSSLSTVTAEPPRPEYHWIEGAEDIDRYAPGGYHPVNRGDVLHERYRILNKLGHGAYSTVWLARDTRQEQYVALKVCVANSPPNETKVLKDLSTSSQLFTSKYRGPSSFPKILDEFTIDGPNGAHACYTMPPARASLREVSSCCAFRLDVARALAAGLVQAVAYLHSRGYVHGDIHLYNVLAALPASFDNLSIEEFRKQYGESDVLEISRYDGKALPPNVPKEAVLPLFIGSGADTMSLAEARIILSDFGEAYAPAQETRLGRDCCTPHPYRPPEAHFEPDKPLSFTADIWSLAFAIWDILGVQQIITPCVLDSQGLIAQYVDVLGPLPQAWWDAWEERPRFFDDRGLPTERGVWPPLDQHFEEAVQKLRREDGMGEFGKDEKVAILDLMRRMLTFRPEDRPTAEEVLDSEWMVKWALPDLRQVEVASYQQWLREIVLRTSIPVWSGSGMKLPSNWALVPRLAS
ncbi:kinase domain-containing protein [Coprinopsis sp. MPI-PUGE-AT-0042]|nr:kinase domain-containing protein [Coprinopsis sp. MPI-PUGE-AT-0042]